MTAPSPRVESAAASALLGRSRVCVVDGETFEMPPLTLATLILVSEGVSGLPTVEKASGEQILWSVLRHARSFGALADIAAVLILGAKGLEERRETWRFRLGPLRWGRRVEVVDRRARLAERIRLNVRPTELFNLVVRRLQDAEVGAFFALTTSLSEVNLLRPTKEVGAPGTTARGR